MKLLTSLMVGAFFMFSAVSAHAQDYAKGVAAYQTGDFATAMKEWLPLAEQGHVVAQYNLGLMYHHGDGVVQDYAESVKWFRLASEQGVASAQYSLGLMYDNGDGVVQDYAEAVKWYRLAAEQGDASAQYSIGWMYGSGNGVVQDYAEALKWYRLAAPCVRVVVRCSIFQVGGIGQ
jgi:uncharacterized protein